MNYISELDELSHLLIILNKLKREVASTHNKKMRHLKDLEKPNQLNIAKSKANLDWQTSHTNTLRNKSWEELRKIVKAKPITPKQP